MGALGFDIGKLDEFPTGSNTERVGVLVPETDQTIPIGVLGLSGPKGMKNYDLFDPSMDFGPEFYLFRV